MTQSAQPTSRKRWIWWLFLLALLARNIWVLWPTSQTQADIPYSVFLAQVRAGNITRVQIAGDQITGAFA